ncbi:MAG: ribose-5-phosphate isomerase RpiA [Wenzhouxiangellaceae bacterium]|nr:ribose-5-phosphate isomerase RpiA [Wenzhouxiangellaceae bacterium]
MSQQRLKIEAAKAALKYIEDGMVLGVGTGSTVEALIDELGASGIALEGAVSSSDRSTERLKKIGVSVLELNHTGDLELYIDGADEVDRHKRMIKGGGGALTREKVIAAASRRFVCIVDESKVVDVLGEYPLPVEVIPMARSFVARQLTKLGGQPELRDDFMTDNGNVILDVRNLDLVDPVKMEAEINAIPGAVTCGLFARRGADEVLVSGESGISTL